MTLYEVTVGGIEMAQALEENGGELTPDLEAKLDQLLRSGKDKLDSAARVVKNLDAEALACAEEAKRLSARATSFKRQSQSLKNHIALALDTTFGGKVKTALFTLWSNSTKPSTKLILAPGANLEDLRKRRPDLVKMVPEFDLAAATAAYLAKEQLPGEITVEEDPGHLYCNIR